MHNTLTAAELKRRGMAAIEEGLRKGPVHIVKRNGPAAVVLTEEAFQRLSAGTQAPQLPGLSAMQWLLQHPLTGRRDRADIDAQLVAERAW
jgi:hypothetical protein